jgi:predicted patatin/cPLA2 family phospholipase
LNGCGKWLKKNIHLINKHYLPNPDFYMVLTHAQSGQAEYIQAGRHNLWMLRASSSIPVLTRQAVEFWVNLTLMAESQMLPCTLERRNKQCIKLMVIRTRPQALF